MRQYTKREILSSAQRYLYFFGKNERKGRIKHTYARNMEIILAHAHTLMYTLLALMPTRYQRDNLEAMRLTISSRRWKTFTTL